MPHKSVKCFCDTRASQIYATLERHMFLHAGCITHLVALIRTFGVSAVCIDAVRIVCTLGVWNEISSIGTVVRHDQSSGNLWTIHTWFQMFPSLLETRTGQTPFMHVSEQSVHDAMDMHVQLVHVHAICFEMGLLAEDVSRMFWDQYVAHLLAHCSTCLSACLSMHVMHSHSRKALWWRALCPFCLVEWIFNFYVQQISFVRRFDANRASTYLWISQVCSTHYYHPICAVENKCSMNCWQHSIRWDQTLTSPVKAFICTFLVPRLRCWLLSDDPPCAAIWSRQSRHVLLHITALQSRKATRQGHARDSSREWPLVFPRLWNTSIRLSHHTLRRTHAEIHRYTQNWGIPLFVLKTRLCSSDLHIVSELFFCLHSWEGRATFSLRCQRMKSLFATVHRPGAQGCASFSMSWKGPHLVRGPMFCAWEMSSYVCATEILWAQGINLTTPRRSLFMWMEIYSCRKQRQCFSSCFSLLEDQAGLHSALPFENVCKYVASAELKIARDTCMLSLQISGHFCPSDRNHLAVRYRELFRAAAVAKDMTLADWKMVKSAAKKVTVCAQTEIIACSPDDKRSG